MDPGAVLLLYTDGLMEERGTGIELSLQALADQSLPVDGPLEDLLGTSRTGRRTAFPRTTSPCSPPAAARTDGWTAPESADARSVNR